VKAKRKKLERVFECQECFFFEPCRCEEGVGFCTHHKYAGTEREADAPACHEALPRALAGMFEAEWRWGLRCAYCGKVAIWFVRRPVANAVYGVRDLIFGDGSHPRWDLPICCQHCGEQLWAANFQTRFLVAYPRAEKAGGATATTTTARPQNGDGEHPGEDPKGSSSE